MAGERLEAGDQAPPFALSDQHGSTVHLDDFRGRKLLVYFYPEADTPGCTTQSCDVRDHRQGGLHGGRSRCSLVRVTGEPTGTPTGIRTPGLLIRSQTLYPD